MFWVHFYHWAALVMLAIGFLGIVITLAKDDPSFMILFIIGLPGFVICLHVADTYKPIPYCVAKPGDEVVWGGHDEGKAADWWVFIPTNRTDKFCEVHSRELYNMGNGYKLSQTYVGVLVDRP